MPASTRTYGGDQFVLSLNGTTIGFLKSAEGGTATSDVVLEAHPVTYFARKHLGVVRYEDIITQLDLSLEQPIYDWIAASWTGKHTRKEGSITAYDTAFKPLYEQQFFQALLREVTIPALNSNDKNPASLQIKLMPEVTRLNPVQAGTKPPAVVKQTKIWQPANFSLTIPGLDCAKVAHIDSFTVKQTIIEHAIGETRDYEKQSFVIEFPNLRVIFPESSISSWSDWFENFVIKGNNTDDQEKTGVLTFLAPDRKTVLASIQFFGLGIFRLSRDNSQPNSDQLRYVAADLYCQRMEFIKSGTA